MRQEEIWDVDAAANYDPPGTGMFAPEALEPMVARLERLAGDGSALEFAIGTGRVWPSRWPSAAYRSPASNCRIR